MGEVPVQTGPEVAAIDRTGVSRSLSMNSWLMFCPSSDTETNWARSKILNPAFEWCGRRAPFDFKFAADSGWCSYRNCIMEAL